MPRTKNIRKFEQVVFLYAKLTTPKPVRCVSDKNISAMLLKNPLTFFSKIKLLKTKCGNLRRENVNKFKSLLDTFLNKLIIFFIPLFLVFSINYKLKKNIVKEN